MLRVCVVISDLYLFQEIVILNPCLIFSRNLILSFIEKVTTGTMFSTSNHEIDPCDVIMMFYQYAVFCP